MHHGSNDSLVNQMLGPHWTSLNGDKFKKYPFNWYGCVILPLHALKYPELELGDKREEISFFFFYLGNTGEQDENRFNIKV